MHSRHERTKTLRVFFVTSPEFGSFLQEEITHLTPLAVQEVSRIRFAVVAQSFYGQETRGGLEFFVRAPEWSPEN